MSVNLYNAASKKGSGETTPWLICESAIVAETDDPDKLGRVKVIIPSIDEDNVFDDWVVPAASHCLGDGFGMLMTPAKGQEVLISGVLGQKFNLVYHAAVYNEDAKIATELNLDWPGIKVPKNLTFIATLIQRLVAQNVEVIAEQLCKIQAENIESLASQLNKTTGQNVQSTASAENKIEGQTIVVNGTTITISANGNVAVTASGNLTLQGRMVNKVGPAI